MIKYLNFNHPQSGFSLLELMTVMFIIALVAVITMPLLHHQLAAREVDAVARRFIAHAHFARQQALHLGQSVIITPVIDAGWDGGWAVRGVCNQKQGSGSCLDKVWLAQPAIDPIFFKNGGRQFMDPHTSKRGILFNAAGAAKTAQGGFVANRLILGHARNLRLERQLILGSGGRWRICDPARDIKHCH